MTSIVWPPELPTDVLVEGYDEAFPDPLIRTKTESGVAKVRRRFTAIAQPLTVQFDMTRAQVDIFESFLEDTLKGGALPFDWTHPRKLIAVQARIIPPVKPKPLSGKAWVVPVQMEILP